MPSVPLDASAQCIHQIDDIIGPRFLWWLDLFALIFFAQQIFQCIFIAVLKFVRLEVTGFRFDDVLRKIQHIFGHAFSRSDVAG